MRKALHSLLAISIIAAQAQTSPTSRMPDNKLEFSKQVLSFGGEEINIIRDTFGVPHILAKTRRGAYFGGGYAVAHDRLFQLERHRRDARGELAEIEGPQAFQRDRVMRIIGYTEAEYLSMFSLMDEDLKQSYQAYADGINQFIKEAISENRVPAEFKKAGLGNPPPWKITDSMAVGIMMAVRFGSLGGAELVNARVFKILKAKFGNKAEAVFDDMVWVNDPNAPTTIPGKIATVKADKKRITRAITTLAQRSAVMGDDLNPQDAVLEYAKSHNLPTHWGSFCWVISPKKSASGSAVLVGNLQMEFSTPSIAHEIHYSAADLNVAGMGFAGIPGVLVGHNDYVAWSMTSGQTDLRDIFAENLNPQNKNQYLYKGSYLNIEKRVEVVKVKGEQPRELELYHTVHGPVISWDSQPIEQAKLAFSRAASYSGHEYKTFEAIYKFSSVKKLDEFARCVELMYTNHNFIAATVDGDIGYWHSGRLPARVKGQDPRLPAPGTGEYDWAGLMPFSKMPRMINPKQGYIFNWNNKPASWWNSGDIAVWGEGDTRGSIEQYLKSRGLMTFEQVRDITQRYGVRDKNAEVFKPFLLAAIDRLGANIKDSRVKAAGTYLRAWDNKAIDGSAAKKIFDAWFEAARNAIFDDEFKELKGFTQPSLFARFVTETLMLHVLEGAKADLPMSRDYLNGRNRDEVLVEALIKALDELASKYGPQLNLWAFNQPEINLSPLPGIPETERGTYTHAVELSKPVLRSISILPPGQSEDPSSPHYSDQREMAGLWKFKQMLYRREDIEKHP